MRFMHFAPAISPRAVLFSVVVAVFCVAARGDEFHEHHVDTWTRQYGSRRARYYLNDARRQLDQAIRNWIAEKKGERAPDPYLKIWDAQSQISAALSWDDTSPGLWFDAGNVTFTLVGLMREIGEGEMMQDVLSTWQHAMHLEAAAEAADGSSGRPLSRKLVEWIEQVARTPKDEFKKKVPQRLWLRVRADVVKAVRTWDVDAPLGQPRGVTLRQSGRLAALTSRSLPAASEDGCAASPGVASCEASATAPGAKTASDGDGWLGKKMALGRKSIFPTHMFRTNVRDELGDHFFDTLSEIATAKYMEFRRQHLADAKKRGETLKETQVNDAFFQFQETHEPSLLKNRQARQKWPELYETDEFKRFLRVARDASIAYLQQTGAPHTAGELERSWVIAWTAVYPTDLGTQGRHGWHTHQESVVSGVLYVNPKNTPILFADPRGAPPIEDYEQYRADDLLYEPKAPFDEPHQVFAQMGDIVVFPSWLVHKVPPPMIDSGGGFRVAYPFNFHLGAREGTLWDGWERTAFTQ